MPQPTAQPAVQVVGLDHLVLNVADVERSLAFYCGELGLDGVRVDEWRRGEVPFASVRVDGTTIIDLLATPRTGQNVDHVCLVIAATDLDALVTAGRLEVVGGPANLFGARGQGRGIYVRDPDGNTIELRTYE